MPMWVCDSEGCGRPAVRNLGDCTLCNRHLCSIHLQPPFHRCPKWEDADAYDPVAGEAEARELTALIDKIDTAALAARASFLRQGTPCEIAPLRYDRAERSSVMGGMNYHVEICFDDGVRWIARIRRFNATSPPARLRDYIVRSEAATLGFLEKTGVPAPRVYDFALEQADNPVGVGYILMEKLPGRSLRWSIATREQRSKVMSQLADTLIELRKYPFDVLGSLTLDRPGDSHIGALARESLTDFAPSGVMRTMGPFSSLEAYHRSSLQLVLDLILRGEMYSDRAVDAYLVHRFLVDLIPSVLPEPESEVEADPEPEDQKFYLKHADDKGDHILVDDDFNVTGIIDWEWAHTAPPAHAFNSPVGLLPVADFYSGSNDLGDDEAIFARLLEEKGRRRGDLDLDLGRFVRRGRLQHRCAFCCGYDLADWDGFQGLFRGLRDAAGVDGGLGWEEWKGVAMRRYAEEAGLRLLLSRQGDALCSQV